MRGPQSALFGRNALGGIVNITSGRPSLTNWTGSLIAPVRQLQRAAICAARRPVRSSTTSSRSASASATRARDGFTTNDVTGNDLDSRSALFGKAQILWKPNARWEARGMFTGERARDGDYALNDLARAAREPVSRLARLRRLHPSRHLAPTVHVTYAGPRDRLLDHHRLPEVEDRRISPISTTRRCRSSRATTPKRTSSSPRRSGSRRRRRAPIVLSDRVTMKWQAGVFLFTQNYEQDAVNNFSPFVLSQFVHVPVSQHSPQSALDDRGVGVYGQGTLTFAKKLDVVVGARGDREHKEARPEHVLLAGDCVAPAVVDAEKDFPTSRRSSRSPTASRPTTTVYGTAARGFKAGGFNAASPAGAEAYGQEHSWNYEGGVKTSALGERLSASIAAFPHRLDATCR